MLRSEADILSQSVKRSARGFRRIDTGTSRDLEEAQKWEL
jgi:hypothetical protein